MPYYIILHCITAFMDMNTLNLWLGGRRGFAYCCNLNKSPSSLQQVWSPSITTHFSLTRIKANQFKSHLLSSQSLQHDPYWCCVKHMDQLLEWEWQCVTQKWLFIFLMSDTECLQVLTSPAVHHCVTHCYWQTVWIGRVFKSSYC